ncbi:MAG: hypothetical protein ABIJ45_09765 [Candidatus Zixiibacteriota bacterium]
MNKFLKKTALFLIILLGINMILFMVGKKLYFGAYSKHSLKYKTYLLSDSHGVPLKNFTEKYGVYNFSAESDSYFDMNRKLKYLIKKVKLDTVYLTADDHTLSPYREIVSNEERSLIYSIPDEYDNYYEYLKDRYLRYYLVLFQPNTRSVIRRYVFEMAERIFETVDNDNNHEEIIPWNEMSEEDRISNSEQRALSQFPAAGHSDSLKISLLEIIETCKENKITLIGVKFPLSSEYVEILDGKTYGAEDVLKSNGIDVLDYTDSFKNRNQYFANQDHLNDDGGQKFAELLYNLPKRKSIN